MGVGILEFYRFTSRSSYLTPFGDSIFRCTTKDGGERRAKGLRSRPLDSGFLYGGMMPDVRTLYVFALVHFTRFRLVRWRAGGVRFARLRRKAKHRLFAAISLSQALLPPDSCLLLQVRLKSSNLQNNRRFANFAVRWLRECSDFSGQRTPRVLLPAMLTHHRQGAARRGKGISGAPPPT